MQALQQGPTLRACHLPWKRLLTIRSSNRFFSNAPGVWLGSTSSRLGRLPLVQRRLLANWPESIRLHFSASAFRGLGNRSRYRDIWRACDSCRVAEGFQNFFHFTTA
jgi:hypothetical protein